MKIAKALNLETGQVRTITAHAYQLERNQVDIVTPEFLFAPKCGDPLNFRPSGKLSAHFARAKGFGLSSPSRQSLRRQAHAAFAGGTKTLLMLDGIFGYKQRPYDFSSLPRSNKIWPLGDWIFANKGDFNAVPVPSLSVAINEIRKLSDNLGTGSRTVSNMCFAYYGGAVIPYSQLYVNGDEAKLLKVHQELSNRKNGIATRSDGKQGLENDRFVGMPRIFRVSATGETKRLQGKRGLKGNRIAVNGQRAETFITSLDPAQPSIRETEAFEAARGVLVSGHDVFVLATPKVGIDPEDRTGANRNTPIAAASEEHLWRVLGLSIKDAARQIVPVGAASGQAAPLLG